MLSSHSTLVYTLILRLFKGIKEYTKFFDIDDRRSLEITLYTLLKMNHQVSSKDKTVHRLEMDAVYTNNCTLY